LHAEWQPFCRKDHVWTNRNGLSDLGRPAMWREVRHGARTLLPARLERCSILRRGIRLRKRRTDAHGEGRPLGAILSSLAAFIAAGARPPTPLARAIVLALAIKVFMFPQSTQPVVDASAMARAIGPSGFLR
jgi:hypothetical protein